MKYLSIDIEATGLNENDYIIEFAMIPFDSETSQIEKSIQKHYLISCPSFKELEHRLDPWVIKHNKGLIEKAHKNGINIKNFKKELQKDLESAPMQLYFKNNDKITLFGKSLNAIDLPFLIRDLGWNFMRKYFNHQQLDLSSIAYMLADAKIIPEECTSGSKLMKYLNMGEVCHTALEDAYNTASMYLKLLEKYLIKK